MEPVMPSTIFFPFSREDWLPMMASEGCMLLNSADSI